RRRTCERGAPARPTPLFQGAAHLLPVAIVNRIFEQMSDGKEPTVQTRRSVVLDFDGTVTVTDLLDRAALEFGDPAVYDEVETGLDGRRLPLREVIHRELGAATEAHA